MTGSTFPRGETAIVGAATFGMGEAPGFNDMDLAARAALEALAAAKLAPRDVDGLSCVHPGMYGLFLMVECAQQLMGQAGARQVPGAKLAVAHGNGGVLSSQATLVLGTAETL